MRTEAVGACPICGGDGPVLYRDLRDRVFQAPGQWSFRRCDTCGSLWLDPRPVDDDLPLAYDTYFTHSAESPRSRRGVAGSLARKTRVVRDLGTDAYVARRFGYEPPASNWGRVASLLVVPWAGRRLDAEFKVMRLNSTERGRLLDVGCGDGGALVELSRRGWDVRGLDFDADAVAVARARGLPVDLGGLRAQGYPTASFEVVTMSHSLEHVPRPREVLEEVRRILVPAGKVVVLTPNASSWLHRRVRHDWQPLEPPRHLQVFTRSSLSHLMAQAGFSQVHAETTARGANGVARAAWKLRRTGRWDMASRPSLAERVVMETIQQWEALKVRRDPDAGEELAATGIVP
ncbi:MAG: class I SAM-dependent methyltransferase [Actinomycetota bacterium]|nr:class I SAM-dependent methyltransferase [Actinomycetota bacterium]